MTDFCQLVGGTRDVYFSFLAVLLHSCGDVDGIAPDVICEFFYTDDPSLLHIALIILILRRSFYFLTGENALLAAAISGI